MNVYLDSSALLLHTSHRLRGMDALHVSAAVELSSLAPLVFASWDKDQRNAARREGLEVFPASI